MKLATLPDIQRLLPQAPDSERGLLGAFMRDPDAVGAICAERNVVASHFHIPANALIYCRLLEMWTAATPIDFITVTQKLCDVGEIEEAGGAHYVTELSTRFVSVSNASEYVSICEQKRLLRVLFQICTEYAARARDEQDAPHALVEEATVKMCAIGATTVTAKPKTPKEIVLETAARMEDRVDKKGVPDNVMLTGLKQIDEAMSGIRPADYVLISGKEKSGKTSLAFNIFENVVFVQKKRAQVISLEMKIPEISDRLFSSMGRINLTNILNGWLTEEDSIRFQHVAPRIAGGKFQWRDDLFSLGQIVSAFRQYKGQHPDLELGIVDYLQLIDGEKTKEDLREQAIAHISRTLRRLAGELNIAIIMLVQLNEDGQVRESRSPGMDCTAHIRIEPGDEEGLKWARIVYQRNGPSNVGIPLAHLGQYLRFEPGTHTKQPDQPKPKKRNWHQ